MWVQQVAPKESVKFVNTQEVQSLAFLVQRLIETTVSLNQMMTCAPFTLSLSLGSCNSLFVPLSLAVARSLTLFSSWLF